MKVEIDFNKDTSKIEFTDEDFYSLDYTLAKIIYPSLKEFRQNHLVGYPSVLGSQEKWEEILDKMIYAFQQIYEQETWVTNDEKRQQVKEGLGLFAEWYTDLWN